MVSWSTCAGHACYAAGRLQGLLGAATAMQEEEEGLYRRAPPRSDNDSLSLPEAAQGDKKTTEWDCMGRYIAIHRRKRWLGLRGRLPSGGRCSNQSFWRPAPWSQLGGWDGQAFNTLTTSVLTTGGYYRQGHKTQKCVYQLFICFQSTYVRFCAFSESVRKNNCEDWYWWSLLCFVLIAVAIIVFIPAVFVSKGWPLLYLFVFVFVSSTTIHQLWCS